MPYKFVAMAWIYLKMFGQITESLCNDLYWTFEKEDFKHALAHFVFEDEDTDAANQLVNIIKMRFNKFLQAEFKCSLTDWAKQMFAKVRFSSILNILYNII